MTLQYEPDTALAHLCAADEKLAAAIAQLGDFAIRIDAAQTPYQSLLRSIVFQQLSGKAASTIHGRLLALFDDGDAHHPSDLLARSEEELRGAGLSRNKVAAVRDLAARTLDGTVPARDELVELDDESVIARITEVRGIGRWTVEMLLIFSLGRPDVLPVGDLGVRRGCQRLLELPDAPTPKQLAALAEPWRPYRSVASWYLWRLADDTDLW
jgi:3-methyladenine DNA glycosylase/8-oxoguanine DNA glycosylase